MSNVVAINHYGGGISPSDSVALRQVRPGASATSGRNVIAVDFKARRVIDAFDPAQMAANLIAAAWPARSENAQCVAAAADLGIGVNTVRRIVRGDTRAASWPVMLRVIAHVAEARQNPLAVMGLAEMYAEITKVAA